MPDIRVQDEQGNVHVFPDGSTPEMIAKAMGVKAPDAPGAPATPPKQQSDREGFFANLGGDLWDAAKGFGKLLGPPETAAERGAMIVPGGHILVRAGSGYYDAVKQAIDRSHAAADKGNTAESMIESAAAGLPLVGPLVSGVYHKAENSDLLSAAGVGASRILQAASMAPEGSVIPNPAAAVVKGVAGGASAAMDRIAPLRQKVASGITEGVLGVTRRDRVHLASKSAIGDAALKEITASTPEEMLEQANTKIQQLSTQLDDLAVKSEARVSLQPVRDALDNFADQAERESVPELAKVVEKIQDRLNRRPSGAAIRETVTPAEVLDLKRGIGKMKNWGTESEASLASPVINRIYGLLNDALESGVPEAAPINARLQALMGVADKTEGLTNAPGVMQRAFGRLRAPTGALASSTGVGGAIGYAAGGPVGAAVGGTVGATVAPFAQEAISSPTMWMKGARLIGPKMEAWLRENPPPPTSAPPAVYKQWLAARHAAIAAAAAKANQGAE